MSAHPTILITGATSGIGLALAERYASKSNLILHGKKPLTQLQQENPLFKTITYIQADLSTPTASTTITNALQNAGIHKLDIIIHNAAQGYYGHASREQPATTKALLHTNLHSPISLTHALIPKLNPHAKLVFISSIAADLPAADYATYSASKAALSSFARNLRLELPPDIHVQVIYPGATRTTMHAKSGVPVGKLNTNSFASVTNVAKQIERAINSNKAFVTLGTNNRIMRFAGRHASSMVDMFMREVKK